MSENIRVKRLLYQSMHRGCKETDAMLGRFAKSEIDKFSKEELDQYEEFISEDDWDIYAWLIGTYPMPEKFNNNVVKAIINFDFANAKV